MSVQIQTVEFERRDAFLSELEDGPPFTVHGVALGAEDVTVGQSGVKKLWPAEELEKAADSLQGRNLVVDHDNKSSGVVGQVTKAGYKDGVGVIYEAELFDEELAEKIDHGLLEVSIRGKHVDVAEMEETDDGAKVVEEIVFENLSIVPTGASSSNTIEIGETDELSMAELSEFTETLDTAELQEIEPGMWVKWGDMRGVTISQPEDGEIEVDIYEESDGKWRSTGETEMVSTDDLSEWDVDEEEDIGAAEDDDEDESEDEESESDEEEASEHGDIPDKYFFESEDDAMDFIEDKDGLTGVHEMDGMYVPGDTHEEFMEWWEDEEEASARRGEGEEKPLDSKPDLKESRKDEEHWTEDEVEELQEIEIHSVDFSGTTTGSWSKPAMEDFDTDDLSEIDDHFLVSKTGFPPENYTDLALPVVEPNGNLNLSALQNAKARGSQVEGLSGDDLDRAMSKINSLANENFEDAEFGDEEEASTHSRNRTVDDTGDEQDERDRMPRDASSVNVLTGDDLRQRSKSEESELDDITTKVDNMTEDIEAKLAELDEPVAVEQDDLEELQDKADRFEEMSETLDSLKERTDILDEVDRSSVEELADAEEPVVVESARMESLEDEAEQVKTVYAAALSDEVEAFDAEELADRFSISELREKYEEQIGDPAEELTGSEEAEPRSGDVEEEELEERAEEAEEESEESEELSEEEEKAEEMREELREKILSR